VTPANAAKTYLEKCMEHLTFCDMASVEHSMQELNQKLIKGREARIEKFRELRELRKQMSEYDNKLASIMDKISKAENDISAANDVTRLRQQHQPQEMNELYERVEANPKLLLEMFPHEIRSAQQEQSQQNQEG
jgi:hypothetical protein